ncbi:MAG: hypothetical protein WC951_04360 [Bacteroidales bacterium]
MKRLFLTAIAASMMLNLSAQRYNETEYPKIFQKLVLDIGATPFSVPIEGNSKISTYNFSLGYQIGKKADIRFNADILNQFENYYTSPNTSGIYFSGRLVNLSLGTSVNIFNGKNDSFLKNISSNLVGKLGIGISPEHKEQESIFYDVSFRTYFGNIPYIGLGINHQMYGSSYKPNSANIYISFGLDF